ncbi:Hsp20/alpha crystallin family protein [Mesobacillus jeotgali]|uniref:Hsp20/alpha crystallin family protein n=1 Tax=Mesobacillus jeotgali TaxID=129985 RepID=UPI0009A866CE|nr:Hsp20/alpha crystallin family protein [Mesobacillus jeotgali]
MFPWNMMPFDRNTQKKFLEMKPEEIENYVQQMMGKMLQPDMKGMFKPDEWLKGMQQQSTPQSEKPANKLNEEIFETHDFVYVRVPLKEDKWLNQMKMFYTSNQVIFEHIPQISDKHTIVLPATVKRKGASAIHRDGILELRLPKIVALQFSEIDIST